MPDKIQNVSLLIFSIANPGGCERIACGLANELSKRNYSVSVINIYNNPVSFFPLEKKVTAISLFKKITAPSKYHFPFVPLRLLNLFRKKEHRPDLIIGVGTDMIIYALLATRLLRIPIISWEHFNFMIDRDNFLVSLGRKLSARHSKFIVTLTQKDKLMFEENMQIKGEVVCIPNFMTFPPASSSSLNSNIAIAAGRYTHQKGFDNLIKIWEKVAMQHPDWKLQIIGKGEDEPILRQMITERKLEDVISLIPASHEIAKYYCEASLFLLSSRWEGLPMVIIEAKSFGLPIISFDCDTGPRDIIQNGIDGILIKDGDNEEFAETLNTLLADRQQIKKMGQTALENSKQFDATHIVPFWQQLFFKIENESKTSG